MTQIRTTHGHFTDAEFEALATRYFRSPPLRTLPGPIQVDRLLSEHGVMAVHEDWARAVAQRALTKVILAT
jgi:hypothetical protein